MANEFCPRCGNVRAGDLRFCRQCQYDFEGAHPTASGPVTHLAPAPAPRSRSKALERLLFVGIAIAVVIAVVIVVGGPKLPTIGAAPGSTATVRPTTGPAVTPEPDFSDLGTITFGRSFDEGTLLIDDPITRFRRTYPEIAWSAQFSEAAGATSVTFVFARVGSGGSEEIILTTDQNISNPTFDLIANAVDLATLADNKVGRYVLRYLRDSTILAEGEFELIK